MSSLIRYVPNALSFFRMLSPVLLVYLHISRNFALELFVFICAAFSDFLDGFLARKYNASSFFGAILDATADKIMVNTLFIFFYLIYKLPEWLIIITLLRDFGIAIMSVFFFYAQKRQPNVLFISKVNTTLQLFLLFIIYISYFATFNLDFFQLYIVYLTGLTTFLSGISYLLLLVRKKQGEHIAN